MKSNKVIELIENKSVCKNMLDLSANTLQKYVSDLAKNNVKIVKRVKEMFNLILTDEHKNSKSFLDFDDAHDEAINLEAEINENP